MLLNIEGHPKIRQTADDGDFFADEFLVDDRARQPNRADPQQEGNQEGQ